MYGDAIIEFPQKDLDLTPSGKKVIRKLTEAAKLVEKIYLKQKNFKQNGANFYPLNATKLEIQEAAKRNPEILSPYTMVERDKKGNLIAIPYHIKFKPTLLKIAKLIKEASKLSEDTEYAKRLIIVADSLLNGSYESSDIFWLTTKTHKISLVIGPIERYDDKLFFKKCSYQAWVGVIDKKQTADAIRFKDYIVSSKRKVLIPSEKVEFLDKIKIRVDDTLIFSGLIAHFMFTSSNLPNDVKLMEKYGSKVTIFKPAFKKKFNEERCPIFHSVFDFNLESLFAANEIEAGALRNTYLHEISHPLLRYEGAEKRLKEYFPIFDEIAASTFGVKACGSLLLKDAISQHELEAIMLMYIALGFSWWLSYLKEPSVIHYAQGFAIAMNYFIENGAIRIVNNRILVNFNKLFLALCELSDSLERTLAMGTYEEAQNFVDKYASLTIFELFKGNLTSFL